MELHHMRLISIETSVKNNILIVKFDGDFQSVPGFLIDKLNWIS